ncbi:SDR family NAD(P)-dependent oxidoreductase [Salinispora vitiensis]|uniref:SDR family NAD(P)-dependent oxidoreductase n=1 Tax=Salinispora vitiensis TaxID=999544 RepID=UPI0003663030|nr:SDR family NAD(P)-dependent oxidoreductase [Salinispora vitiensis]
MSTGTNRCVLITGTSSGIGLATAIACARAGWTTVATMRDTTKAEALNAAAAAAGVSLDIRALDVTGESVRESIDSVAAEHGRLDAVINNAGAAFLGTVENDDLADIRACVEVNFFGVIQVSQAAMPHLRANGGRLLTISSVGGSVGQPFNEAYCAAKFAVEGFMQSLAPVARTVGVQVGVVEPAAVTSEFVANANVDIPAMVAQAGPYAPALTAYVQRVQSMYEADTGKPQTSDEVAAVVMEVLTAPELPFRTQTSNEARDFVGRSLSDLNGSAVLGETRGWVGQ